MCDKTLLNCIVVDVAVQPDIVCNVTQLILNWVRFKTDMRS